MPTIKSRFPKPDLSADAWELYTSTQPKSQVDPVARKLNTATWRALRYLEKNLLRLPELSKKTVGHAIHEAFRKFIDPVMEANRDMGAWDSEPRNHAYQILESGADRLVGGRHLLP